VACPALPDQRATALPLQARVRDKDGGASTYARSVTATNAPPVTTITATSPTAFRVGGALGVEGRFTDKGANDAPWTYTIYWGDGTTSTGSAAGPGLPIAASHVYAKYGTFSANMYVRDKDGAIGWSARITVTVSP
jgi:hypothetical protein